MSKEKKAEGKPYIRERVEIYRFDGFRGEDGDASKAMQEYIERRMSGRECGIAIEIAFEDARSMRDKAMHVTCLSEDALKMSIPHRVYVLLAPKDDSSPGLRGAWVSEID